MKVKERGGSPTPLIQAAGSKKLLKKDKYSKAKEIIGPVSQKAEVVKAMKNFWKLETTEVYYNLRFLQIHAPSTAP